MRNDGRSWYRSLQTSYSIRNRWSTLCANYTFAKTIDPENFVMQRGPAGYDWNKSVVQAVTALRGSVE